MKLEIKNRFSERVIFEAEIECLTNCADGYKLGLAVRAAVKAHANLTDANLAHANLTGAHLTHANLTGANLTGAKWRNGIVLTRAPLYVHGLHYPVVILENHMQIGCELHSLDDWASFENDRIIAMDGKAAAVFWRAMKEPLLALAKADGRGVVTDTPETVEAAE